MDIAGERAETVFRIVEEALHNVERHAQAQRVTVTIAAAAGTEPQGVASHRMVVTVDDDGLGFDTDLPCPGHYGLIGIREQAALIGAALAVRSAPGKGTTVRLEIVA